MTAYEWEEEVPQPKPPTRRCELLVRFGKDQLDLSSYRPATQADIARALGVSEGALNELICAVGVGK